MEKFNRAERRHQTARLKNKRKHYHGFDVMTPLQLGAIVTTPQACSCIMGCGNARRFYGRTLKEVIHQIDEKNDLLYGEEDL